LYIGTSASEVLHFVQIPPEPVDPLGKPSYILASRLQLLLLPIYANNTDPEKPGVQQILLLPKPNKVCILCNSIATFYSLPELSPVFGNVKVTKCSWVGGVDLNLSNSENGLESEASSMTILMSSSERILVVRVGEQARSLKVRHLLMVSIYLPLTSLVY
jgi:vacuolar protein sorting-associated protein 3